MNGDQRQLWTGDDIQITSSHGSARRTDPVTSHLAALDAARDAPTMRILALAQLCAAPEGLTDFELADRLTRVLNRPVQQTSAGKRRGELRDAGQVRDSGLKRPAPSGSLSIVWAATLEGRDVYLRWASAQSAEPA
jgi:hypothetical protein